MSSFFFFFNDTATTEIYTLSLHDALPIWRILREADALAETGGVGEMLRREGLYTSHLSAWRRQRERGELEGLARSEEHTSELQSQSNLVCRLLLEKKKKKKIKNTTNKQPS